MDGKLKNAKPLPVLRGYAQPFDEHEWININRQKTGVVSNIRLLDIANRIIGKYRGLCEDGRISPVPHYNTCLAGIRAVAKRCGITSYCHVASEPPHGSHDGIPPTAYPSKTVSSMLGHKSIKTTQIYAKITERETQSGHGEPLWQD